MALNARSLALLVAACLVSACATKRKEPERPVWPLQYKVRRNPPSL